MPFRPAALHCNDEAVHVVLPRRKAGELDAPERDAVVVTPEVLESLFHLPLAEASHRLVRREPSVFSLPSHLLSGLCFTASLCLVASRVFPALHIPASFSGA